MFFRLYISRPLGLCDKSQRKPGDVWRLDIFSGRGRPIGWWPIRPPAASIARRIEGERPR